MSYVERNPKRIHCTALVTLECLGLVKGDIYTATAFLQWNGYVLVSLAEFPDGDENTAWFDWGLFKIIDSKFGEKVESYIRQQEA